MTSTLSAPGRLSVEPAEAQRPDRASGLGTLLLLASIVLSLLAGSAAPTPLYAIYQAEWRFTPITTTIVFGVYAVAVLAALLTLGKVSDHVGRRPVLLAALIAQAATMLIFTFATDVPELLIARVAQGIATGSALGALGAAMLDVDKARGTLANAVAPFCGTALGALVSGLVVQYLPAPEHLIYLVLLGVFVLQAVGVAVLPETVGPKPGVLASLVPEIRLPRSVRRPVLAAVPVLLAVWSLAGFYGSLGPALVYRLTGSHAVALGGLGFFVLAGIGVVATIMLRNVAATSTMLIGIIALAVGVATSIAAIAGSSSWLFFAGTAIAGFGFGAGFQGSIRTVVPLVEPHERAGILSLLYVVSYFGLGVPAVVAGYLVVHAGGLTQTATRYGIFVIVCAVVALVSLLRPALAARPELEQS